MTRFLLICLVFCAYPLVVPSGENIVMDEFQRRCLPALRAGGRLPDHGLPPRRPPPSSPMSPAITISKNLNNATPTLSIPFWIFLGSTFFGFAGAALVHLIDLQASRRRQHTNVSI